jgi:hypothetical protein
VIPAATGKGRLSEKLTNNNKNGVISNLNTIEDEKSKTG